MTRQIETHKASRVIETTTQLDVVELEADLFVYQRTVSSKTTSRSSQGALRSSATDSPAGRQAGFVNAAGRTQLLAGKAVAKNNIKDLMWLEEGDLEQFRQLGFPDTIDILVARWGQQAPDPWKDWFERQDRSLDTLVQVNHCEHLVYDRQGNPLPVALLFDYINGHVDNENYELEQAFAHLRARPDIRLLWGDERKNRTSATGAPTTLAEATFHIPYYNATEVRDQALQFLWIPEPAAYSEIFSDRQRAMRHELVLSKDALGLRSLRKTEDPYA